MIQPITKHSLAKFFQITEVDEKQHCVYGTATEEVVDRDGEICIYADTKVLYQEWSDEQLAATSIAGVEPSKGNIRLQHTGEMAGKVVAIDYEDVNKRIKIATEPISEFVWNLIRKGFITGFSHGGKYYYRNCAECGCDCGAPGKFDCPTCKKQVTVAYACKPSEISYVDRPCLGTAVFAYVKADGSREVRKFSPGELAEKIGKTKRVADEDLPARAFAYVGSATDPATWRLPIKFSTETKTKTHIRNALARFGQTQDIPDGVRRQVKAKILSAARRHGIVTNGLNKSEGGSDMILSARKLADSIVGAPIRYPGVQKSMYNVKLLVGLLQDLSYLQSSCRCEADYFDGDENDIVLADEVVEAMKLLVATLKGMVNQETDELLAVKAAQGEMNMTPNEMLKAARATLAGHFRKAAAHNEAAADNHKCICEEHLAMHETHKAAMEGCEDVTMKAFHKGMAAHHKSLSASHLKLSKACMTHNDHLTKMATAEEEAAAKVETVEVAKVAATDPAVDAAKVAADAAKVAAEAKAAEVAKAAAAAAGTGTDEIVDDTIKKMVTAAIQDAVKGALTNIGQDDSIKVMVGEAVKAQVKNILGGTIVPTGAKVAGATLVARAGAELAPEPLGTDDIGF